MPELEVLRWPQDRTLELESVAEVCARAMLASRRRGSDSRRQPPQRLEPRIDYCPLIVWVQAPLRLAGANGAGD